MKMIIEYENEDFVIVSKPAGLPVYSTKKHEAEESVISQLLEKYPQIRGVGPLRRDEGEASDPERPGVVHRLDKQTSGLLAVAKSQTGFDYLRDLFKSRNISKEYVALVFGELKPHGVIDKPLTKIGHRGQSRVRADAEGKPSVTEYWGLQTFTLPSPLPSREGKNLEISSPPVGEDAGEGVDPVRDRPAKGAASAASGQLISNGVDRFTLVRVKLHTGRTHQIRVHFSSIGHPVMGDDLYGKPESQKLKTILSRQFLHASKLEFQLPDGTWLEVQSELPDDLKKVLEILSTKSENRNNI